MSSIVLALAALAATAAAHGTVTGIVADGKAVGGFKLEYFYMAQQGQTTPETPGWSAENLDNGFVAPDSFTKADIICHKNAKPATSTATVAAGGKVDFQWSTWPQSHVGPMLTYVAKCAGDCADADKEALKWVKIDEAGFDGKWASDKMIANNNTWSVTVPSTLAAGNYVFRHETIALHSAASEGGAQAYPQCLNIAITGSGTDEPEGVAGTALYKSTDKGIMFDVYAAKINYPIPGPALYAGGSGSGTTPTKPVSSAPAASAPAATSAAASPSAPAASATATPAAGSGSGGALPKTFTIKTFIAWLEEQAASGAKARRHARQF